VETVAFTVVIPARMRSTRLPGKMLADVAGKPLVAWVAERARASGAADVVIATDHPDIEQAVRALGWRVCMTSPAHPTGTDRLAEAAAQLGYARDDIVVNVQGDEPLVDPKLIRAVAQELARHPDADIVWVQEEPANMGALFYMLPRLRHIAGSRPVLSVKRSASASPATGSTKAHELEQRALIALAFSSSQ